MATYAIGDIHGCFADLKNLLKSFCFDPELDTLWFVGDLVNRGEGSLEVLRFIKELRNKVVVLGNHDFHLLAIYHRKNPIEKKHTLQKVLEAPDAEKLINWLRLQPLIHYDNKLNYIMTHAGIYPAWDKVMAIRLANEVEKVMRSDGYVELLANMYGNRPAKWSDELVGFERLRFIINSFVRMRFCDWELNLEFNTTGEPFSAPENHMPWFAIPGRKTEAERLIFGHWAALRGEVSDPNLFALDTGCIWGGSMTAMRLEDGRIFTTPCDKVCKI